MALAIFIDETFQLVEKHRPDSFYFLASALIERPALQEARERLIEVTGPDVWHSTDQLKTEEGRQTLESLCELIGGRYAGRVYVQVPLISGDRLGEASRAHLFRNLILDFSSLDDDESTFFVYETRLRGQQTAADARTISDLQRLGKVSTTLDIRPRAKADEPLLWLSDAIATAYRHFHLFGEERYWRHLVQAVETKKPT